MMKKILFLFACVSFCSVVFSEECLATNGSLHVKDSKILKSKKKRKILKVKPQDKVKTLKVSKNSKDRVNKKKKPVTQEIKNLKFDFGDYKVPLKPQVFGNNVVFKGLKMVDPSVLADCISSDLNEMFKSLWNTGFFVKVHFKRNGNITEVYCVEKPLVDKVAFEGNNAASDEMLKNVLGNRIGEGKLLTTHTVRDVLADFQAAYNILGYCSAVVTPKIIKKSDNVVDLVFEIIEGEKTTVKKIMFVGNREFTDDELKDVVSTKEEKFWRFWDYEAHVFREDHVATDIDALSAFYKNNGYPNFLVSSVNAERSFDRKSYFCTYMLEEGKKYHINDITLASKVSYVNADDFKKFLFIKRDSLYDQSMIKYNVEVLRRELGLKNYPFADIVYDIAFDKKTQKADIAFSIVEKEKAFVEKIEIVGNTRTLDKVIRREFEVHEGDPLNVYNVQRTVENLKGLDYFEDVEIDEEQGSTPDKKVLILKVKEKESTANVKFGLNVSDSEGFGGTFGFTENNLQGTGRVLSSDVFWMQKHYGASVDIFEPYFMDKRFGCGLRLSGARMDRKNVDSSVINSCAIAPYIRYMIAKNLYHILTYSMSFNSKKWWGKENQNADLKLHGSIPQAQIQNVTLADEFGKYTSSEVRSTLIFDRTNISYEPSRGYDVSLTNSFCGLGGNVKYLNNKVAFNYYHPLTTKVVFIASAQIGYLHEMSNTRTTDRYYLGGDGTSMRGFDFGGVGPREIGQGNAGDNSLGANKYWTLSFMAKTPLSTRELGINGVLFVDFGSAWGTKYKSRNAVTAVAAAPGVAARPAISKRDIQDSSSIRGSAGIAIEWKRTPFGTPLSIVFGFPFMKKSFDKKQTFTLTGLM